MIHPHKEADARQVPKENVQWFYHSHYYDGPITGLVVVKSPGGSAESLWAEMFDQCDHYVDEEDDDIVSECGFYRRYQLIRLKPEVLAEELRRHKVFEEMVGTHCNYVYDEHGNRRRASVFNPAEKPGWHDYYKIAKAWPKWEPEGELVGWFQSG